jgi:hypothetical protein
MCLLPGAPYGSHSPTHLGVICLLARIAAIHGSRPAVLSVSSQRFAAGRPPLLVRAPQWIGLDYGSECRQKRRKPALGRHGLRIWDRGLKRQNPPKRVCVRKSQGERIHRGSSGNHNSRRDSSDFARLISAIHPIAGLPYIYTTSSVLSTTACRTIFCCGGPSEARNVRLDSIFPVGTDVDVAGSVRAFIPVPGHHIGGASYAALLPFAGVFPLLPP